jgi:hypothetical protein
MFGRLHRLLALAAAFGIFVAASPVLADLEETIPVLRIGKAAALSTDGTLAVPVHVQCGHRWEVVEAFVYVVQSGDQSANAVIPVECGANRERNYNVTVPAIKTGYDAGEATATAYVLLMDPDDGSTTPLNETATILIRSKTRGVAPE